MLDQTINQGLVHEWYYGLLLTKASRTQDLLACTTILLRPINTTLRDLECLANWQFTLAPLQLFLELVAGTFTVSWLEQKLWGELASTTSTTLATTKAPYRALATTSIDGLKILYWLCSFIVPGGQIIEQCLWITLFCMDTVILYQGWE